MNPPSLLRRLQDWARIIRRDVIALWFAARDPRVPWPAKIVATIVAAYALSPIDLIPDFLPVIGYLDDMLLVPLGIWAAVKLVPASLMAEHRLRAVDRARFVSKGGLAIVVSLWLAGGAVILWCFWPVTGSAQS